MVRSDHREDPIDMDSLRTLSMRAREQVKRRHHIFSPDGRPPRPPPNDATPSEPRWPRSSSHQRRPKATRPRRPPASSHRHGPVVPSGLRTSNALSNVPLLRQRGLTARTNKKLWSPLSVEWQGLLKEARPRPGRGQ